MSKQRISIYLVTHDLLQVLLLADVHHDQTLFDQTQAGIILGVPKLYRDMWAGDAIVLHVQHALTVLDVTHHAVHHVRTSVVLEREGRTVDKTWGLVRREEICQERICHQRERKRV